MIISRDRVAKIFHVPLYVVSRMWPEIPGCRPVRVFRKARDHNKPQAEFSSDKIDFNFDPRHVLTTEQLAKRLQVSVGWIQEKCRSRSRNKLPVLHLGRFVRFYWLDVCEWMKTNQNGAK